jgi:hypothetical protein
VGAGLAELGEAANLGEAERPAVSRLDERGQEPAERVLAVFAPTPWWPTLLALAVLGIKVLSLKAVATR